MGCVSSSATVVRPLRPPSNAAQDQTGSKSARSNSAVSKVTQDSGVEVAPLDNGAALPGEVPGKPPPPLGGGGLLEQEHPTSSEILEELQSEGIIQVSPRRATPAGEAYTVTLGDSEGVKRRPPARLQSLRVKRLPSREDMEEKMTLADKRRKRREDELTARLKSARVRRPAAVGAEEEDDGEPGEPQQGEDAGDEKVMNAASESNPSIQRGGGEGGQEEVSGHPDAVKAPK
uniref:uncharacterized protein stmnd1 n=1 Tax=Doryrhamphus excisus TaxID=161450 RepID=UPI0025AEA8B4|nr:uncharacterized protein stmnd1 [Doryrhamphus excisus]